MHTRYRRLLAVLTLAAVLATVGLPTSGLALTKDRGVGALADYHDRPDAYERGDNKPETAPRLPEVSAHNFDTDADIDWSIISAETTGQPFVLETVLLDGTELDTEIHVFEKVGTEFRYPSNHSVVANPSDYASAGFYTGTDGYDYNDDSNLWGETYASTVYFRAPHPGTYYVLTRMNDPEENGGYLMYETKGIGRRIAGENRFATAAMVSRTMWSNTHIPSYGTGYGPDFCIVANGLNYPDALAGSGLALEEGTSVLLTGRDSLNPETEAEIERLSESRYWEEDPFTVYIFGGPAAVSDAVATRIKSLAHVSDVVRIGGADRYETAVKIADQTSSTMGAYRDVAFVVTGTNFADALSVGPVANAAYGPILLTTPNSLSLATLNYLKTNCVGDDIYIVGGPAAVSALVEAQIKAAVGPAATVTRVAGANRYGTSLELAKLGVDEFGLGGDSVTLVSGANFPDGLTAASLTYWTDAPLLLTQPDRLVSLVPMFEGAYGPTTIPSYVVGGPVAVEAAPYEAFKRLWSSTDTF